MTQGTSPAEVERWLRVYVEGSDNPDLRAYASSLDVSQNGRQLWLARHLLTLARAGNGPVLEVGCGFGWDAVAMSLMGGCHVVANDIRETMTSVVAERVAAIREQGAPVSVEVHTGDICTNRLDPDSFVSVVCNQTVEHVHDLDAMMSACYASLRPGGRIVVTNDSNALNAQELAEAREIWERRDRDWDTIRVLQEQRPIENRDIKPYAVMREEIVRRSNPSLDGEAVEAVVTATAGLLESEIEQVAASYAAGGPLPEPPALSWCRNPVTGEYCERQLDPYELKRIMADHGFEVALRHGFRKFPLSLLNAVPFRPLNNRLFQVRPFFILVGQKPR